MKNVLIVHGIQGHAGVHWQQWLHDKLVKRNYQVIMPELPNSIRPDRTETLEYVQDLCKDVNFSDLIIIGHSLGVTTALDLIESEKKRVKGLVSVSGFHLDYGMELNSYFLKEREVDLNAVKALIKKAVVIYGDDDPYVPQDVLRALADRLGVEPIVIAKGGHLNTNSGYTTFSLLLKKILEV